MKLIRFGEQGKEKPGIIFNEKKYDVSGFVNDYDEVFFGQGGLAKLEDAVKDSKLPEVAAAVRLGPPVARPSKIVCIGLNYAMHAKETNATPPEEPILFFKATSSICGPEDHVVIPRGSVKTDWEVELAVVIGKKASYVEEATAINYVAGYCLHNDISEREFQLEHGGQWVKGKSCDTFAPLGPWLATPEEIGDVDKLPLWLSVNGQKMQDGNTDDLIFKVPFLISYISRFMTLLPGDIISTGTPAGVGLGRNPPVYLKAGDVVELGIEGLGIQKQRVVNWSKDMLR